MSEFRFLPYWHWDTGMGYYPMLLEDVGYGKHMEVSILVRRSRANSQPMRQMFLCLGMGDLTSHYST